MFKTQKSIIAALFVGGVALVSLTSCSTTPTHNVEPRTVTKTVEVVPQACLDALDEADHGFTVASKVVGALSAGITAASNYDADGVSRATGDVQAYTSELSAITDPYNTNKTACRAKAGK